MADDVMWVTFCVGIITMAEIGQGGGQRPVWVVAFWKEGLSTVFPLFFSALFFF
jgi:hypothetical protein